MDKIEYLTKLKTQIESMEKHHQVEILKYCRKICVK